MAKSKKERIHLEVNLSRAELVIAAVSAAVLVFVSVFVIVAYTPVKNLVPGYPSPTVRRQMLKTAMHVDSLERCIYRWELYTENLSRIARNETPIPVDSLVRQAEGFQTTDILDGMGFHRADSLLRDEIERQKQEAARDAAAQEEEK